MWTMFARDLQIGLAAHAYKQLFPDNEYINLQFKVKFLWKNYVASWDITGEDFAGDDIPGYSK